VVTEATRQAIMLDPAWSGGDYTSPPERGIRLWREILAFLAARTPDWYRYQLARPGEVLPWLEGQVNATIRAFDANDYIYQSWAYDVHDVGTTPGMNGDYARALRSIEAKTLIMVGTKDLLNPEWEPLEAARYIRDVRVTTIRPESVTGHFAAGGFIPADVEMTNAEVGRFLDVVTDRGERLK
jgi:homoserine O-acetyltransferase